MEYGEIKYRLDRVKRSTYYAELKFSHDDRYLLVSYLANNSLGILQIIDAQSKEILAELDTAFTEIGMRASIHPDGSELAYLGPSKELVFLELPSCKELRRLSIPEPANDVQYAPKGNRIAWSMIESKAVQICDSITGREINRLRSSSPRPDRRVLDARRSSGYQ
jgi:Tol biopolymer transport system component